MCEQHQSAITVCSSSANANTITRISEAGMVDDVTVHNITVAHMCSETCMQFVIFRNC